MGRRTLDDVLQDARSRLSRLQPEEAAAAQRAGAVVVDTRSNDARQCGGVIPDSLHIPLSVLEWRLDPDNDPGFHNRHIRGLDQRIVLVCEHGCSSILAAARLQELGFSRVTDVVGGFEGWVEAGLPVHDFGTTVSGVATPVPT